MIIPQNYSSSIFEILSNIDPLQIILLNRSRGRISPLARFKKRLFTNICIIVSKQCCDFSLDAIEFEATPAPIFLIAPDECSTTDAIYDDIITIRAALANLLIFIFQCCSTTKHTPRIYMYPDTARKRDYRITLAENARSSL